MVLLHSRLTAYAQLIGWIAVVVGFGLDLASIASDLWFVTLLGLTLVLAANAWACLEARRRPDVVQVLQQREAERRDDRARRRKR
jgi:membrane protein implicated in regulation of membrane protease activity